MAKIPFDIKFRPQIESGEYKVETKDGRQVRVVCWDVKNSYSKVHDDILALVKSKGGTENALFYAQNGYCLSDSSRVGRKDLFIVTPEEELSEFEMAIHRRLNLMNGEHLLATELLEETKGMAAELLALARKELALSGNIVLSVEEFDKKYVEAMNKGKAEALKDLPRWRTIEEATTKRTDENDCVTTETMLIKGWINDNDFHIIEPNCMVNHKMLCIPVRSLEKLPGFKED